ncbi:MAG: flagellar basal body rod C-terminal domain-containing protein, partial [Amphiplicatus sp.]
NPSSLAAKADALAALDQAFASFSRTQDAIADDIANAQSRLEADVARANALIEEVSRLNVNVPDSPSSADLLDARLSELSKLLSITVTRNERGQASVALADGTLIASPGDFTPLDAAALGAGIVSGEIAGLRDLRDADLPALSARVSGVADGVAAALNAAYAQNVRVGAAAPTGDALLVQAADGTWSVNSVLLADPARLAIARPASGTAGANDGAGATALAFVGGSALVRDVAEAAASIGAAAKNAELAAETNAALAAEVAARVSAQGGVSLDEELSNLILYQRAYGANARVIAAIDELWQALLAII